MSWLGDNFKFEAFNAGKLLKNIWEKPDQTLLGAQDPVGAGFWNNVAGTDYNANLNLLGGPSGTTWLDPGTEPGTDTYSQAEAKGINTKPAEQTHDIAEVIAIAYLLNSGAGALGGGAGGAGAAGGGGAEAGGSSLFGMGGGEGGAGLLGDIGTTNTGATTGMEWGGSFGGEGGLGSGMNWGGSFGAESGGNGLSSAAESAESGQRRRLPQNTQRDQKPSTAGQDGMANLLAQRMAARDQAAQGNLTANPGMVNQSEPTPTFSAMWQGGQGGGLQSEIVNNPQLAEQLALLMQKQVAQGQGYA